MVWDKFRSYFLRKNNIQINWWTWNLTKRKLCASRDRLWTIKLSTFSPNSEEEKMMKRWKFKSWFINWCTCTCIGIRFIKMRMQRIYCFHDFGTHHGPFSICQLHVACGAIYVDIHEPVQISTFSAVRIELNWIYLLSIMEIHFTSDSHKYK